MTDFTDREQAAINNAKAHLRRGDPHRALACLRVVNLPDDPPIAASLPMPTWNADSGMFATVPAPLLGLLEVSNA